jgi:hypothetical protein
MIYRLFISFADWHHEKFYTREYPQEEYRHALVALAEYVTLGHEKPLLLMAEVIAFRSKPMFEEYISKAATMMELFIILHEYGHVAGGHLSKGNVRHITLSGGADVVVYNKSQQQEFEADMFAFNILSSRLREHRDSLAKVDAALYIGIVLKFFELCDSFRQPFELASQSHPPAADRWKKIAQAAEVDKYPRTLAARLDQIFSVIMHGSPEVPDVVEGAV